MSHGVRCGGKNTYEWKHAWDIVFDVKRASAETDGDCKNSDGARRQGNATETAMEHGSGIRADTHTPKRTTLKQIEDWKSTYNPLECVHGTESVSRCLTAKQYANNSGMVLYSPDVEHDTNMRKGE